MVSNTFTLFFSITALVLLLSMVVVLIVFLRRSYLSRSVRIMIIGKTRSITPHRRKNVGETFDIGDNTYIYDPSFEVKRKFWKEIYYLEGVPLPVNWWEVLQDKEETNKLKVGKITLFGANFKNIIQAKLMNNILKRKDDLPIIIVLLVIGLLVLIDAYFGFQAMQGVNLADTPENKEMVLRWVTGR